MLDTKLTTKTMKTGRGSTYTINLNENQCNDTRDALAKSVYSGMFDWIIAKLNITLGGNDVPDSGLTLTLTPTPTLTLALTFIRFPTATCASSASSTSSASRTSSTTPSSSSASTSPTRSCSSTSWTRW